MLEACLNGARSRSDHARCPTSPAELAAAATDVVAGIETALVAAAPHVPRLLHGFEATTWPLLVEAGERGYDTRIGFEDSVRLPDGSTPDSNADMVRAARDLIGG